MIGLIGLDHVAPRLHASGLQVISEPDYVAAVTQVSAAAAAHGPFPVLLMLNDAKMRQKVLLRLYRHVQLTVVGTPSHPVAAGEGYSTYQLPGTLRDLVKQAGALDFDLPEHLWLDTDGQLLDADATDWGSGWQATDAPAPPAEGQGHVANVPQGRAEPAPAAPRPAAAQPTMPPRGTDEIFNVAAAARSALRGGSGGRSGLGEVVIALSGSGGVGKSTFSLGLAARAADRGKRVVLIDANLGQGDLSTFLRVAEAGLPTMYDAVIPKGDLRSALIDPTRLNEARDARLKKVEFAFVQAPTPEELATQRVTAAEVNRLIERAREIADLVVVDTQIVEADDPRHMVQSVILPQLGRNAWALAIAGLTSAGLSNLLRIMEQFQRQGILPSHLLSALSKMPRSIDVDHDRLVGTLQNLSVYLGTAWADDQVLVAMNRGEVVGDQPALAHLFDTVLLRVFGMPIIAEPHDPDDTPRSWWSRLTKRGGRR